MKCYLTCKRFMQEIAQERNGLVTAQTLSLVSLISSSRFCISSAVCVWCSLSLPSLYSCCSSILVLSVKRVFFCLHVFFSLLTSPVPNCFWLKILARKTGNILKTPDLRQFSKGRRKVDRRTTDCLVSRQGILFGQSLHFHHCLHHRLHYHLRHQRKHQSLLRWVWCLFSRLSLVCESVSCHWILCVYLLDFYVSYKFYLLFLVPFFLRLFLIYISCFHLHRVVQEKSPAVSMIVREVWERVKRERKESNVKTSPRDSCCDEEWEKRERGWVGSLRLLFPSFLLSNFIWRRRRRRWNFVLLPLLFYSS